MIPGGERWTECEASRYETGRRPSDVDAAVARRLSGAGRVLETGCGPCMIGSLLSGGLLVETDACRWFLPGARARSGGRALFCTADASALPFRDGSFDAVVSMAVLHHLEARDLQTALDEAFRVLASGGRLVLAEDWAFDDPTPVEAAAMASRFACACEREHHMKEAGWTAALCAAGFEITHREWPLRPFDPPAARANADGGAMAGAFVMMLVLEGRKP